MVFCKFLRYFLFTLYSYIPVVIIVYLFGEKIKSQIIISFLFACFLFCFVFKHTATCHLSSSSCLQNAFYFCDKCFLRVCSRMWFQCRWSEQPVRAQPGRHGHTSWRTWLWAALRTELKAPAPLPWSHCGLDFADRMFMLVLFIVFSADLSHSLSGQGHLYVNHWAVRITGGPEQADAIADKYGYINLGQVSMLSLFPHQLPVPMFHVHWSYMK